MMTKTIISKFKKMGINFKKEEHGNWIATSKTQTIEFSDQDGEAVCLCTYRTATAEADRIDRMYTDSSYQRFHDTVKSAINTVLDKDAA